MQSPPGDSSGDLYNFEQILKKNVPKTSAALYANINKRDSIIRPQDVMDSVYSQIRSIQLADSRGFKVKDNPVKKSTFLQVNRLPVYNEVPKPNFDTQCFSNTQLINIIDDAEALHQGMTQEFESTFLQTQADEKSSHLQPYVDENTTSIQPTDKIKKSFESPMTSYTNQIIDSQEFDTFTQTNVDATISFLDNVIERVENDDRKTKNNQSSDIVPNSYETKTNNLKFNDIKLNTEVIKPENTLKGMCGKVLDVFTSEFASQDIRPCLENLIEDNNINVNDTTSAGPVNPQSDNMEGKNDVEYEMKTTAYQNGSTSPVFKIRSKKVTKTVTDNLVVLLKDFEEFEKIALPIIDIEKDTETCKHLINSQIIGRELWLNIGSDRIISCDNNRFSPILEKSCELILDKAAERENGERTNVKNLVGIKDSRDKRSDSLKDEILFSSDEENDLIYRELQDMPLTVELESSFNDHSDVLTKTMFVGFQTASSKSIQVCTDSFHKARGLLDEDNGTDFSINDLVEIFDEKSFSKTTRTKAEDSKSVAKPTKISKPKNCVEIIANTKIEDHSVTVSGDTVKKQIEKPIIKGFMTASNKMIKIPDTALELGKKVFINIDLEDKNGFITHDNTELVNEDLNTLNKDTNAIIENDVDDKIDELLIQEFENIEMSLEEIEHEDASTDINKDKMACYRNKDTLGKAEFIGFKTANNKNIEVSAEAMAKTNKVFQDIDTDINLVNEDSLNDDTYKMKPSTSKTSFAGFKTANNRAIKISDAALTKSSTIFKDIDNEHSEDLKKTVKPAENLRRIETKEFDKVRRLEYNLQKQKLCEDYTNINANISKSKTPINNFMTIPKKSSARMKKLFQNLAMEHPDENEPNNDNSKDRNAFTGFQTASHKTVNISVKALQKSKKIFEEIDSYNKANPFQETVETERNKNTSSKENICLKLVKDNEKNDSTNYDGFKTASNKSLKLNITSEALARSKRILEFDVFPENDKILSKTVDKTIGFQTASNRKAEVSKQAKEKTKGIFNDIDISETKEIIKDFQTASNKRVEISKKAMEKTNSLFSDIDLPEHKDIGPFTGFQTASNKAVKISKEALEKTKELFNDLEIPELKEQSTFAGFQTASNKKVEVSKEAVEKTKSIFNDIALQDNDDNGAFKGLQTASNKKVSVSDEAMKKTKALFNDIEIPEDKEVGTFLGFQTGNRKKVTVSEQALIRSREFMQDVAPISNDNNIIKVKDKNTKASKNIKLDNGELCFKTANNKNTNVSKDVLKNAKNLLNAPNLSKTLEADNNINIKDVKTYNLDSLIDTQVLDNFDKTLFTEDFNESPKRNKRSGSPILSCPKAKKRKKFEAPYKEKDKKHKVTNIDTAKPIPINTGLKFSDSYKKNKIHTVKDLSKMIEAKKTIDPYILQFNLDNILDFVFETNRNDLTNTKMTITELKELFLSAVNKNLVPEGWLDNHLKLIMWKLLSYETKFNYECTTQNVVDQLKFRYDKELYNAERPAFRKILEKDDVPTKTMVLCVARVLKDGVTVISATTTDNIELLLTDGWYFMKATIDKMLSSLVSAGRIVVGSKIVTSGAELMNCEQGMSPWEDTTAVRLKLSGNSTRPAAWHARLGYTRAAILSQLSSVKVDGGRISKLRVFVTRVYPLLYVEKFEDGSTITRSERLEHQYQMKHEAERELMMERIYEEVQKEFSDQESQDSETQESGKRRCYDSGSQIAKMMKRSRDPMEFRAELTSSQVNLLQEHMSRSRQKIVDTIQERISERMLTRNVVTLARGRVAAYEGGRVCKGMLSIWKPNEAVLDLFREGAFVEMMNAVPTAIRYSEIQITAGRQTMFRPTRHNDVPAVLQTLRRKCYRISDVAENPSMSTENNEIDTAGIVFLIEPSHEELKSNNNFQNVYLADVDKNIISINFWGGVKKFGFENILDTGQVVACANLQRRAGNTRKNIPQFRVTEFSNFTKMPRNVQAREIMDELVKKMYSLDRRKFCDDCIAIKNNYTAIRCLNNNENESPYRFNRSEYSFTRNQMFIETPIGVKPSRNEDVNFNLTGLDFESSFKQETQELSPTTLQRKKKVNDKIARLRMYGEPPPLSPINIINKSINAKSSYKSPLVSNVTPDNLNRVAVVNNLPEESPKAIPRSQIISMKRSYVKSVPVKLNFEDKNESVDHFAGDFDASPPLSLD